MLTVQLNHFWQSCSIYVAALKACVTTKLMLADSRNYSAQQSILKGWEMWLRSLQITTDYTEQSIQLITSAPLYPFWNCHVVMLSCSLIMHPQEATVFVLFRLHFEWESINNKDEQYHVLGASNIWPLCPMIDLTRVPTAALLGDCTCLSPVM